MDVSESSADSASSSSDAIAIDMSNPEDESWQLAWRLEQEELDDLHTEEMLRLHEDLDFLQNEASSSSDMFSPPAKAPPYLSLLNNAPATCSATITGKVQLALKELATDPTVPVLKKKSVMALESAAATALASVAAAAHTADSFAKLASALAHPAAGLSAHSGRVAAAKMHVRGLCAAPAADLNTGADDAATEASFVSRSWHSASSSDEPRERILLAWSGEQQRARAPRTARAHRTPRA